MTSKTRTTLYSAAIDEKIADIAYEYLKNNVPWEEGIYSKKERQISRKGYSIQADQEDSDLIEYINSLISAAFIKLKTSYIINGIYLNYYRNGLDFCPNHSHPGTIQVVISLGATRKLTVGKKEYQMKSGDMIIFGSSIHGIPKEPEVTEGRISIAVFLISLENISVENLHLNIDQELSDQVKNIEI